MAGLNLAQDIDGSATLVTNPAGERSWSISDGARRGYRTVQLDATGAALLSNTRTYDTLVTVANYGDVLETSIANALGHSNRSRAGGAASLVSNFSYDSGRRETSRTYGNGITTTRSYQADNLVTLIDAANVEALAYTYDANKNPTAEVRSGVMAPHSWATGNSGFDDQNRLTNWSRTNGNSQSWALTPVNDWQQFTNNGGLQNRTHGPAHEITAIGATPLVHDSRGNLTQDDRGTTMTYDADNMLSAFNANGVVALQNASYRYDALGRRVAKTVAQTGGDVTTVYVLAHQQVVAEYLASTSASNSERKYAYGTYIDEPLILVDATGSTETRAYFHANRQFSTYSLADVAGNVIEFYGYTPYGAHRCFSIAGTDQGTIPQLGNTTLFTGRTFDSESELHYFRARYFSSSLGRFTTHDPILYPDGWNTYAGWFVPHSADPSGNDCPGCDIPAWAFGNQANNSPCVLACCAEHDHCYFQHGCTAASWAWNVGGAATGWLVGGWAGAGLGCLIAGKYSACAECNNDVVDCIANCAFGNHMLGKPLYFCAGGPKAVQFIKIGPVPPNDYADIKAAKAACCT